MGRGWDISMYFPKPMVTSCQVNAFLGHEVMRGQTATLDLMWRDVLCIFAKNAKNSFDYFLNDLFRRKGKRQKMHKSREQRERRSF